MSAIILGDVRKTYAGGVEAVKGVSFAVPDGGFCVLVGPSGCGKSTLLRMVAGLETVSAGEISIGGVRVNDKEPMDRDIAMVFQNYALYPHMSVRNNMAYGLRNRGMTKAEIDARVGEAARILGLDDAMLKRLPKQLSGGQRQRVAMGRAIVRKPQAFLFDEPLSNLDAKLRAQMRIEIRKLQKRLGTTSLYVTHDQLEAMTLADMLVVLNAGKVEQVGAPLAIYDNPASLFVASFIGSPPMNFLSGTVSAPGMVRLEGGFDLAYKAGDFALEPGAAVTAGIRPENATAGAGGSLTFDVDLVEELGAGRLVYGRIGQAPFTVQQGAQALWPAAEQVKLSIPASAVHLFDAKTGLRLPG